MTKFLALLLALAAPALTAPAPAFAAPLPTAAPARLAAAGQALLPIVISPNASAPTKAVAAELAAYLEQISGAKFAVTTGAATRGIVLGTLAEFPQPGFQAELAIRNTYDGKEAFVIHTTQERVLLLGATEFAVPHAAFSLLEYLGCRWFFPAKAWEVIPQRRDLGVSLALADRPKILARRIWYGYGPFPDDKQHPLGRSCAADYTDWARHNRMAASFRVYAGHAYEAIIASHKALFAEHPEYLALTKGKRQGQQLCVSNPGVRALAVLWALDYFAKNPDKEMVSLDCADGDGHCECGPCVKLGSVSNRVFGLANHAARELAKTHPGKMIGLLAYNEHSEPPDFALEPNVYVQLTMGFIRGRYTFDELRELWPQKCRSMGFYDYYSVWLWDFDKLPGGRGANLPHIAESIRKSAALGATSMDAESGNNWGVHGLGYYVANKLMWNPAADVAAITADFYAHAFGPAAAVLRRYYERWLPTATYSPLVSRQFMGLLFRDLDEAATLARDRADVLARLDQLKHYLRYSHLRWLLDHEPDKAKQKALTLDVLTFTYRTRYDYMNHWNAIQSTFAGDAAKKFDEPGWARNSREPKPWSSAGFVTAAETEQWFRDGLAYFQPLELDEKTYDYAKLIPASAANATNAASAKPAAHSQSFQRVERYALRSPNGEPLELDITTGIIAWYRDRAATKWKLEDAKSQPVATGSLPLDGEIHKLKLPVPAAGVYFFECDDSAAGWRIQGRAGAPLTWLPQRGRKVISLGQVPELFFLVPAGTKQLQFFYSGGPLKILGPDRKLIAEVKTDDEVVTVPVPAGLDGQVWSFSPHAHQQLWLLNAPNCFAASPAALLVPAKLE